uniref:GSVIVT00002640001 n=1 Tax=Arundo donax TaxID=35708 RepID=A0A0A9E6Z6_ARUDO
MISMVKTPSRKEWVEEEAMSIRLTSSHHSLDPLLEEVVAAAGEEGKGGEKM